VPDHVTELTFPDLPRMELDQLLRQLVERAQEVMATQGRLRGLLRATQMINGGLTLPVVLHRIAEAARELVGARYAALGVLAPDGGLAEFVHTGMPPELVARIGHLPQGKGLLGALIENPEPIRLARISDDPRSCGFPPGHPPMTSFLGVPVRVRDEAFGNLYLAESTRGAFNADDEELTRALAATAAAVIENARLYEAAHARGEWLHASAAITRRLLSADLDDVEPLRLVAEHGCEVAQADLVTVLLPDPAEPLGLRVEIAVGKVAIDLGGLRVPVDGSLPGQVFTTRTPMRIASPDEHPGLRSVVSDGLDAGPTLVVPLLGSHSVDGVLMAVRRRGRPASLPRPSRWRPASPTRPRWRSSSRGPARTGIARRCSTSASGSPRTCTTTSSNGCSPAACRCRPLRPRSAPGRPPTGSWVPSTTSTPRSRRSARQSSSSSRFPPRHRAGCGPACWTSSPTSPPRSASTPPSASPA
jgi:hypothetical protein